MIDLRSDTVTKPSAGMLQAMVEAEVGDDVFGEDPTVKRLEERVAHLLGKEAALFVPSGVMANQIAIMLHTRPGDEVILAERSHIFHYESGAPALLAGVQLRAVGGSSGILGGDDIAAAVRPSFDWEPKTSLVCIENSVNKAGGLVYDASALRAATDVAREHRLATHLDGARLWNAAVALGITEHELAVGFDTVTVALSKGLGAPVGSVLAGTRTDIARARRFRKLLGGGMRQVGVLAAAGLYAIEHHRDGLQDDHRRARRLAETMAETDLFAIDPAAVPTNIVIAETQGRSADDVVRELSQRGISTVAFGPTTVRLVTHRDVDDDAITEAVAAIRSL